MADANPLDGRGPKPQSPGDRFSKLGRTITLEARDELEAGQWAAFDEEGGVTGLDDGGEPIAPADGDVLLKHDAEEGDDVAVHTGGVVRALNAGDADIVDEYEDSSDYLVSF